MKWQIHLIATHTSDIYILTIRKYNGNITYFDLDGFSHFTPVIIQLILEHKNSPNFDKIFQSQLAKCRKD